MATSFSFEELARRIDLVAREIPREMERVVRKVAIAVDQVVVLETPVDTGRARANWVVSVGAPRDALVEPDEVGEPGTEVRGITNARKAIREAQPAIAGFRIGDSAVFVTNNLPYIAALDAGSSAQAPEGMVRAAVLAGVQVAKREKVDLTVR